MAGSCELVGENGTRREVSGMGVHPSYVTENVFAKEMPDITAFTKLREQAGKLASVVASSPNVYVPQWELLSCPKGCLHAITRKLDDVTWGHELDPPALRATLQSVASILEGEGGKHAAVYPHNAPDFTLSPRLTRRYDKIPDRYDLPRFALNDSFWVEATAWRDSIVNEMLHTRRFVPSHLDLTDGNVAVFNNPNSTFEYCVTDVKWFGYAPLGLDQAIVDAWTGNAHRVETSLLALTGTMWFPAFFTQKVGGTKGMFPSQENTALARKIVETAQHVYRELQSREGEGQRYFATHPYTTQCD